MLIQTSRSHLVGFYGTRNEELPGESGLGRLIQTATGDIEACTQIQTTALKQTMDCINNWILWLP